MILLWRVGVLRERREGGLPRDGLGLSGEQSGSDCDADDALRPVFLMALPAGHGGLYVSPIWTLLTCTWQLLLQTKDKESSPARSRL